MSIQEKLAEALENYNSPESLYLINAILYGNTHHLISFYEGRRKENEDFEIEHDPEEEFILQNIKLDRLFLKRQLEESVKSEGISQMLAESMLLLVDNFSDNSRSKEIFLLIFKNNIFSAENVFLKGIGTKKLRSLISENKAYFEANPDAKNSKEILSILQGLLNEKNRINSMRHASADGVPEKLPAIPAADPVPAASAPAPASRASGLPPVAPTPAPSIIITPENIQEVFADCIKKSQIPSIRSGLVRADLKLSISQELRPELSRAFSELFSSIADREYPDPKQIQVFRMLHQGNLPRFLDAIEKLQNTVIAKMIAQCHKKIGDYEDRYAADLFYAKDELQKILNQKNEKESEFLKKNPTKYDTSSDEEVRPAAVSVPKSLRLPTSNQKSLMNDGDNAKTVCFTGKVGVPKSGIKKRQTIIMPGANPLKDMDKEDVPESRPAKMTKHVSSESAIPANNLYSQSQIPKPTAEASNFSGMIFGVPIPAKKEISMPQSSAIFPAPQIISDKDLADEVKDDKKPNTSPATEGGASRPLPEGREI